MNPTARGLVIVLAVIALMASSAHVALANHKVYFDEDSNRQWPGDPYARFENYVYWTWWQGPSAWWWVDPAAYPSLQSTAAAVIGNWQNAIPELPFAQRFLQAEADLYFKTGADCGSQVPACYRVTDWHWDAIQQANFVFKAEIILAPIYYSSATEEQKQEALAHELGHFYGLHE